MMAKAKKRELSARQKSLLRNLILDPELNECLLLVKYGVPFDVAFSLTWQDRFAWCVILQRFDGAKFNFQKMKFEDPDTRS